MVSPPILHDIILGVVGVCGVVLNILSIMAVLGAFVGTKTKFRVSESLQILNSSLTICAIVIFIPLRAQDFSGQGMTTIILHGFIDIVEITLFHTGPLAFLVVAFVRMKIVMFVGNASIRFTQKWGFGVLCAGMIPAAILVVIRIVATVILVQNVTLADNRTENNSLIAGPEVPFRKLKTIVLISFDTFVLSLAIITYIYTHRFLTNEIRKFQEFVSRKKAAASSRSSNSITVSVGVDAHKPHRLAQKSIRIRICITAITWSVYAITEIIGLVQQEMFPRYVSVYFRLIILILNPIGDGILMESKRSKIKTCVKAILLKKNAVQPFMNEVPSVITTGITTSEEHRDDIGPEQAKDAEPSLQSTKRGCYLKEVKTKSRVRNRSPMRFNQKASFESSRRCSVPYNFYNNNVGIDREEQGKRSSSNRNGMQQVSGENC